MDARVDALHVAGAEGAACQPVQRVRAVSGLGLEGDRHYGTGAHDLTLIAAEALEALHEETGIQLSAADSRRQILTRGVDVNGLVGRRFRIGGVLCEGEELCEPCRHLERLTQPGVLRGLVHRGGLCARVIEGGEITVGDPIALE